MKDAQARADIAQLRADIHTEFVTISNNFKRIQKDMENFLEVIELMKKSDERKEEMLETFNQNFMKMAEWQNQAVASYKELNARILAIEGSTPIHTDSDEDNKGRYVS